MFRSFQILNETVINELGVDYYDEIKKLTNYKKNNGEFFSAALALYVSREAPTKLFFHTDDFPALEEFSSFFKYHQIGYIEDSADLLLLLYRLDDSFTVQQLDIYLSKLFSEYASEVVILEKQLKEKYTEIASTHNKDLSLKENLNVLIKSLAAQNFNGINKIKDFFHQNKTKFKGINDLLENYESVFELESSSNDFLKKIAFLRSEIKSNFIYKL